MGPGLETEALSQKPKKAAKKWQGGEAGQRCRNLGRELTEVARRPNPPATATRAPPAGRAAAKPKDCACRLDTAHPTRRRPRAEGRGRCRGWSTRPATLWCLPPQALLVTAKKRAIERARRRLRLAVPPPGLCRRAARVLRRAPSVRSPQGKQKQTQTNTRADRQTVERQRDIERREREESR